MNYWFLKKHVGVMYSGEYDACDVTLSVHHSDFMLLLVRCVGGGGGGEV